MAPAIRDGVPLRISPRPVFAVVQVTTPTTTPLPLPPSVPASSRLGRHRRGVKRGYWGIGGHGGQVGSHQFKVTPGDVIYAEKLKFACVNDRVALERVLLLGTRSETVIGRPTVPHASVTAVIEEQVLDAKVIIFKKKRRKNYRRTTGHRQELTRLRILDVVGIEVSDTEGILADSEDGTQSSPLAA
eukprot:SM000093S24417  [mRNA]  locus=s93:173417:174517:- [translate_table: standard]